MAAQHDGDDEEQELQFADYTEHTEFERKGYVMGYRRAAHDITKALEDHCVDPDLLVDLFNHCMKHVEDLRDWRVSGDKQLPPDLPDYFPDVK